jgi:predicted Zn-dependent peptidase
MIISVASPAPHEQIVALAERSFGAGLSCADGAPPRPAPAAYAAPVNVAVSRDSRLAHLWLAGPGPAYAEAERQMMAARLMNAVFGSSMSSRLFTAVREEQGLCYAIRSTLDPCSDVGAFLVATAVAPGNAARLIESVSAEMARLAADGPAAAEMTKARAIVKGTSALDREDAAALARLSAFELMHRGFVRSRAERDALADSITLAEVMEASRRYLDPAAMRCAVAGPPEVVRNLASAGCLPSGEWLSTEGEAQQ